MGLYCHINLNNLQEESTNIFEEMANEVVDFYESTFADFEDNENEKNEKNEISYDDITVPIISLNTSNAPIAFREAFMSSIETLCPVRTGYLRSTCHCDISGNNIECYADAEYAQYVEYGTTRMVAQPYFEPSIRAGIDAAKAVQKAENRQAADKWSSSSSSAVRDGMDSIDAATIILIILIMILTILIRMIIELFRTIIRDALDEETEACYENVDIEIL